MGGGAATASERLGTQLLLPPLKRGAWLVRQEPSARASVYSMTALELGVSQLWLTGRLMLEPSAGYEGLTVRVTLGILYLGGFSIL